MPALRALRAAHTPLVLAAQRRLGAFLAAAGEVDRALDFETLGLSALFVDDAGAEGAASLRVRAVGEAARVVCWFGAGDETFECKLRALAAAGRQRPDGTSERVIIVPPAPARAAEAPRRWPDDDRPLVWAHLLSSAGVPPAREGRRPIAVPRALMEEARGALRAAGCGGGAPFVLAQPGAGGAAKRWPVEGFARVLRALARSHGLTAVVHRGPADAEAAAALAERLGVPVLAEPSLGVLAGALRLAALYVGNDSGVSQLAAAVGAPAAIAFTRALWPWRPWWPGARVAVVETAALAPADVESVLGAATAALG